MKIAHLCLAAFYIDDFGYQENVLPKMHLKQGHNVEIIASTETYIEKSFLGYVEPSIYTSKDGIKVTRLPYARWLPTKLVRKLRIYNGLYDAINKFKPDVIFIHGVQFLSVYTIRKYVAKNKHVKVFADGHTDFINSANNWLSKNILHKIIYRHCAQVLVPFTEKFWGVTPLRVDFFRDVYKVPENKTDLLVLGVDDTQLDLKNSDLARERVRKKYGLTQSDIVLITGGKLDERKHIHYLMETVGRNFNKKLKLLVFGEATDEMKEVIEAHFQYENVIRVGWLSPSEVYDYLHAADLAVFPGTHSVLWEQCVGLGLPCIFRRWKGMEHVNVGGNCLFLEAGDAQEIRNVLRQLIESENLLPELQKSALKKGPKEFTYSQIAKKAIGQD